MAEAAGWRGAGCDLAHASVARRPARPHLALRPERDTGRASTYTPRPVELPAARPFISLADYTRIPDSSPIYQPSSPGSTKTSSSTILDEENFSNDDAVIMFARSGEPVYIEGAIAREEAEVNAAEARIAEGQRTVDRPRQLPGRGRRDSNSWRSPTTTASAGSPRTAGALESLRRPGDLQPLEPGDRGLGRAGPRAIRPGAPGRSTTPATTTTSASSRPPRPGRWRPRSMALDRLPAEMQVAADLRLLRRDRPRAAAAARALAMAPPSGNSGRTSGSGATRPGTACRWSRSTRANRSTTGSTRRCRRWAREAVTPAEARLLRPGRGPLAGLDPAPLRLPGEPGPRGGDGGRPRQRPSRQRALVDQGKQGRAGNDESAASTCATRCCGRKGRRLRRRR